MWWQNEEVFMRLSESGLGNLEGASFGAIKELQ
jgi:hypothetical protein